MRMEPLREHFECKESEKNRFFKGTNGVSCLSGRFRYFCGVY